MRWRGLGSGMTRQPEIAAIVWPNGYPNRVALPGYVMAAGNASGYAVVQAGCDVKNSNSVPEFP